MLHGNIKKRHDLSKEKSLHQRFDTESDEDGENIPDSFKVTAGKTTNSKGVILPENTIKGAWDIMILLFVFI